MQGFPRISASVPIIHGVGAIEALGSEAKTMMAGRSGKVFVCTDAGLTKAGLTKRIVEILEKADLEVVVFDAVEANPSSDIVEAGAKELRECSAKVLVTLGGGSSMDAGKAIACLSGEPVGSRIHEYCMVPALAAGSDDISPASIAPKKAMAGTVPAIIAVPTTSGTASETNGAAVITHEGRKIVFANALGKASLTILDAALTVPVPAYPTATCGMDVLTHAIEAFTALGASAYSDAVALGSIKLVARHLLHAVKDGSKVEHRSQMQLASHMAGVAFNMAGLGLVHAAGHPLSAVYHQAHGQTLATMLPHVMDFNLEHCKGKYAEVAMAFGVHDPLRTVEDNARRAIDAVSQLSIQVGTARSIRSFGGQEGDIPMLVQQVLTDVCMLATPRRPSAAEVEALFRAAWDDERFYPSDRRARL